MPAPPLNLVGDYGAGGMMLAFGVTAALLEAKKSGFGQVVDAAMVDGTASMMHLVYGFRQQGTWTEQRGANALDSGAHFYEVYETSDGQYVSVGAIEPQFYAQLLEGLELDPSELPSQFDRAQWPAMKERFRALFKARTREAWCEVFDGRDACVWPLLSTWEAPAHPYLTEREVFVEVEGVTQPSPVPRFSRTPSTISKPPSIPTADTDSRSSSGVSLPSALTRFAWSGALFG